MQDYALSVTEQFGRLSVRRLPVLLQLRPLPPQPRPLSGHALQTRPSRLPLTRPLRIVAPATGAGRTYVPPSLLSGQKSQEL